MDIARIKKRNKIIDKACAAYKSGNLSKALKLVEREIHEVGNIDESPWVLLGQVAFDNKDYDTASIFFDRALVINKNPDIFYDLSICHYFKDDFLSSIKSMFFSMVNYKTEDGLEKSRKALFKIIVDSLHCKENFMVSVYEVARVFLIKSNDNIAIYRSYLYIISLLSSDEINQIESFVHDIENILEKNKGGLDQIEHAICYVAMADNDFHQFIEKGGGVEKALAILNRKSLYYYFDNFLVTNAKAELFLIKLRKIIICEILSGDYNEDEVLFIVALVAKQAWKAEYIYFCNDSEINQLNQLKSDNSIMYSLASLMYFKANINQLEAIENNYKDNKYICSAISILKADDEILSESIDYLIEVNKDSLHVKNMYEENPYPRWTYCNFLDYQASIHQVLEKYCIRSRYNFIKDKKLPRVLVAGCGTGQQPIILANSISYSEFIAIDLSKHSLQYAKHMAKKLISMTLNFFRLIY